MQHVYINSLSPSTFLPIYNLHTNFLIIQKIYFLFRFGAMEANQNQFVHWNHQDERMEMKYFGAMEMNLGATEMNQNHVQDERSETNFRAMAMNQNHVQDEGLKMNFRAMEMNQNHVQDERLETNFRAMEINQNQLVQWNHRGQDERDACFRSLPPGVRFRPTEIELILFFLKRKMMNQSLPMNNIREVNLYQYSPQKLFGM